MIETSSEAPARARQILEFWLGPLGERDKPAPALQARWFGASAELDTQLRTEFGGDLERAARGECDGWSTTPRGSVALVILLDQWSRNIHRGSARMFQNDGKALTLAQQVVARGEDVALTAAERQFLYMPFMHSESLAAQQRSLELFERLAHDAPSSDVRAFARAHHDIVARFGRFPHRNAMLGRASTAAETQFLAEPNSSF